MSDQTDGVFSIKLNEVFEVELDFSGENEHYKAQFHEYIKLYDISDIGTLMNIQNWAASRGVPCKTTVHGFFSIYSWMARLLLVLNRRLEQIGDPNAIGPKKWDR